MYLKIRERNWDTQVDGTQENNEDNLRKKKQPQEPQNVIKNKRGTVDFRCGISPGKKEGTNATHKDQKMNGLKVNSIYKLCIN